MSGVAAIQNFGQEMDIPTFYKGKNVFLTGATGFLGHVLLAKLLRTCPGIGKIYILMREKKGVDPVQRFKELFNAEVFQKVKEECPDYMNKVEAIIGDCLKPNLGFAPDVEEIFIDKINIVFHCAATVRFDAPLHYAVDMNIRCTRDLLEIAQKMKHLKAFVYVSTAFSNCAGRKIVEEKFYDPPISGENIITITEKIDQEVIDRITPSMLGKYPNTYVYTKSIAEDLCRRKFNGIPMAIFRPAIVISTDKEPVPGWINNVYGPTGVVAAAAVGLLRSLQADSNCVASIVPCDYVINALIATAWNVGITSKSKEISLENDSQNCEESQNECKIYNYSNYRNPLTWRTFMRENEKQEPQLPSACSIWAYCLTLNKYKPIHKLYCILLHLLPAIIVDSVAKLLGKEPKLWDAYQKVHKLTDVLSYFSTRQWQMYDDNVQNLLAKLSENDKKIFYFDVEQLDWKEYFMKHIYGIRKYVLKETMDTIPEAKKRRRNLIFVHYLFISIFTTVAFYLSFKLLKLSLT